MPIGNNKKAEKDWADLGGGPRMYNDAELKDFHRKIQRFTVMKTPEEGEPYKILDFNELAVAFGAFSKTPGPDGVMYYRALGGSTGETKRYYILNNLFNQYQDWQRKQDWVEIKRLETFEAMVS